MTKKFFTKPFQIWETIFIYSESDSELFAFLNTVPVLLHSYKQHRKIKRYGMLKGRRRSGSFDENITYDWLLILNTAWLGGGVN